MHPSVCGKVNLVLNQQYISNTQNQIPAVAYFFFVKKELGADTAWFIIREAKSLREKCPNMEFFLVRIFLYSG